jgi:formate dehydrogenase major subunit
VAPSLGGKLQDTHCESCGLCISACPTAAISENVPFKPGPVETTPIETICNYCSVGCAITLHTKGKFITRTTGRPGQVNTDGNLCRYAKFGYQTMNTLPRLKKPMLKENGEFREITFEEAYSIIAKNIQTVKAEENAFFAGARLTSEEMFLIQRLARQAAKSENCGSFHYMGRPNQSGSTANMPFAEIRKTGKVYLLGSEINQDNAVAGFMVQNAHFANNIPVELITNRGESLLEHKVNKVTRINGYYYFVKAANYFLLKNGKQNSMFISDRCSGFEAYREKLLADNYNDLVTKSGVEASVIEAFANDYNEQLNAVIIYSEKDLCFEAYSEVMNLAMITGKLGKTANGIICLKEKNNSEGLLNLGIADPGLAAKLASGGLKNLFIFGEDPIGCIKEGEVKGFGNAAFVMVQDYYMTETAKKANLVMPASFPYESGGSFTNTQRVIQMFDKSGSYSIKECNIGQLTGMLREFGINSVHSVDDAHTQMLAAVANQQAEDRYGFTYTQKCSNKGLFAHGCDSMTKRFDEYFEQQFSK